MSTMLKNEYPLRCVARDGSVSVWLYDITAKTSATGREWSVRAWPQSNPSPGNGGASYDVILEEVDGDTVRVVHASNHLPAEQHGRGVAPALYPLLARRLNKRLLSGHLRLPGAKKAHRERLEKTWRYLVATGEAEELTGPASFVIEGRQGLARPTKAKPCPERPAPTTEAEFLVLMEEVDERLRKKGVRIPGRVVAGVGELSELLKVELQLTTSGREPIEGSYEGDNLVIRADQWFQARYGDRLLADFSPGRVAALLRGDVWEIKLPKIWGRVRFIASRTQASTTSSKPTLVRKGERPKGPPPLYNVLESIVALPDGLRQSLTDTELQSLLDVFLLALPAYDAMRAVRDARFVPEALTDHEQTVRHLSGKLAHPGQARWSALQATEKMYKSYLDEVKVPFKKVHNLTELSALTVTAGLDEADKHLIATVQCSAGVRYGEEAASVEEAVAAHHAALDLSWYLACQSTFETPHFSTFEIPHPRRWG